MDMRRVGAALRAIRIRRRLRQQDVAAKARVSRRLVGEVERGSGTLSLVELEAIAEVLGARLDLSVHWHGADL
ncbi:MAG: helix-turn-helix transcriptional regulator, partial [Chloroflexi bacterium]